MRLDVSCWHCFCSCSGSFCLSERKRTILKDTFQLISIAMHQISAQLQRLRAFRMNMSFLKYSASSSCLRFTFPGLAFKTFRSERCHDKEIVVSAKRKKNAQADFTLSHNTLYCLKRFTVAATDEDTGITSDAASNGPSCFRVITFVYWLLL